MSEGRGIERRELLAATSVGATLLAGATYAARELDDQVAFTDAAVPVRTHPAGDVDGSSATLVGEVAGERGGPPVECWFAYRLAGEEPPRETPRRRRTGPGTFRAEVTDLRPGAEYDVWALASSEGRTFAGAIRTVATD